MDFFSAEARTVGWLAKQASDRFYALYHMRPVLSLATQDGAMLAPEDIVSMVFCNNETVHASVESWDLTPLPQRYSEACKALSAGSLLNVDQALRVFHYMIGKMNLSQCNSI